MINTHTRKFTTAQLVTVISILFDAKEPWGGPKA